MTGRAFVDHQKKLVAFWTPKCACTAVAYWFAEGVLIDNENKCDTPQKREWLAENGYKFNYHEACRLVNKSNYSSVFFTRHPASRLVSCYLNKFVIYQGKKLTQANLLESFARNLAMLIYQNKGWDFEKYRGIRFIDFVEYLEATIVKNEEFTPVDPHWDTQLSRKGQKIKNPDFDFIVHQESFNEDLIGVNQKFGIDLIPPKLNISVLNKAKNMSDENMSSLFSVDLASSDLKLDKHNFLDENILDKLKQIYQVDYDYFKYDPFDLKFIPSVKNNKKS